MTLVTKNDSKSTKISNNYQKFQLKKLACPVMITEKRKNSLPVQLELSRSAGGVHNIRILENNKTTHLD